MIACNQIERCEVLRRDELLENWELAARRQAMFPIAPLQ